MRKQRKAELVKVLERIDKLLDNPKTIPNISMRLIWELQEDVQMFVRELNAD